MRHRDLTRTIAARALNASGGPSAIRRLLSLVTVPATLALAGAPAAAQVVAITGATVHRVSGPPIENGTIVMRDGRLVAVGAGVAIPAGARRIDAQGKWVTPGIFSALTTLGLSEVGRLDGTYDASATGNGNGIVASFKLWEGYNPASAWLQVTRNDGITTVGLVPSGGLLAGQGAVMALSRDGKGLLRAPAAMFGDLNARGNQVGGARGEVFQRLRDVLEEARSYPSRRALVDRNASRPLAARPEDLAALAPVLARTIPLVLDADRSTDIEAALAIARQYNVRVAVTSATEGWKVADALGAAGAYVVVGALNNIPRSFATLGARQDNATLLHRAGAKVVIAGGTDAFNARNVRYEAGVAVSFGMPWDAALRAITLTPAEMYGVAARVGSLDVGKDATLVIWSGDPFEPSTRAEQVFVAGNEVQGPSRQDDLMRRYRSLPADYRKP